MINGGGSRAGNYQSHLLHVQQLRELLVRGGIPGGRIAIFSADGADPAEDLAMREAEPGGDFWLLRGTRLERLLAPPITYGNSSVDGTVLRPATKVALKDWFDHVRRALQPGDTLFLYVTDHGSKNDKDVRNNTITLWGQGETLSVSEMREMLAVLDPGVRVVALMSQCYSGSFGYLAAADSETPPRGNVCGYFASTAERPAYGCYPENRGKDNVGHSFHFIQALAETSRLAAAHARVLVTDQTPDVPITTADVYAETLLARAAAGAKQEPRALADELLREAWRERGAWEPEIRLLDRIAQSFGIFSPRSLAEIEEQAKLLPEISGQLKTHGNAWKTARGDLAEANVEGFVSARPEWRKRLTEAALTRREPPDRAAVTSALLRDLGSFTRADGGVDARLHVLHDKGEAAASAAYRMEVRLGAVLRMRAVLTAIAGRVYLATRGTDAERTAYTALRACEDWSPIPEPLAPVEALAPSVPFPPYEDDVRLAREVLPSWMGINFRQAKKKDRDQKKLAEGAARVLNVYPDSPARLAGLQAGDIVLGPPGRPFHEPRQIREWIMLSRLEEPLTLDVVRGEERLQVSLVPKPFPLKWPELPGPPKAGSPAPPIEVSAYRGALPGRLADGSSRLLFFWATWCAPCKASLPEVLAFAAARNLQTIAITDEPAEQLDTFFAAFKEPFPATVALDEDRRAFLAYGVSGTPTYVLIDGAGTVQSHHTGYTVAKGLGFPGWTWAARPAGRPTP
jgi:cytochrome c biogenesis protein CcmG/thiol:disulfide interchange protein DsbE